MQHLVLEERMARLRSEEDYCNGCMKTLLIPITPATSFSVQGGRGSKNERALMYAHIRRMEALVPYQSQLRKIFQLDVTDNSWKNDINNYVLGGCVGIDVRNLWIKAGYYHRTLVSGSNKLAEPFNIYYSFGVSCLPKVEDWDLEVEFTNGRLFDLDRHYLPSLAVDGWWYRSDKVGVNLGVCYTPTGVFHISSDFYRLYTTLGVCYRW